MLRGAHCRNSRAIDAAKRLRQSPTLATLHVVQGLTALILALSFWSLAMMRWVFTAVVACALASTAIASESRFFIFRDLPEGFQSLHIDAVSANGKVVVGHGRLERGTRAFRWTSASGFDVFEDMPFGTPSFARDVSANGKVVVGSMDTENGSRPFVWTPRGRVQILPGVSSGGAVGVSDDGMVIVGRLSTAEGGRGFRWSKATGMERLDAPTAPYISTGVFNVSADGQVVVGALHSDDRNEAFRWTKRGGYELLGDLPGGRFDSEALAVAADGSVLAGGAWGTAGEPFRWTSAAGLQELGNAPARNSQWAMATDMTADGATIVGWVAGDGAFVWDEARGMRNLRRELIDQYDLEAEMSYFIPGAATAITADGDVIAGTGALGGLQTGWIATVPEPSGIVLATAMPLSLLSFAKWRRRRGRGNRRVDRD